MEAIAIKPQWQHEAFHGAVDEVQDPTGVERIPLTRETDSGWLKQVGLVRDLLPTTDVALDPTDVYRALGLHEGGTVWLSRRPRRPEVRHPSPPSRLPSDCDNRQFRKAATQSEYYSGAFHKLANL